MPRAKFVDLSPLALERQTKIQTVLQRQLGATSAPQEASTKSRRVRATPDVVPACPSFRSTFYLTIECFVVDAESFPSPRSPALVQNTPRQPLLPPLLLRGDGGGHAGQGGSNDHPLRQGPPPQPRLPRAGTEAAASRSLHPCVAGATPITKHSYE